jgi:hypothetical protein
MVVERFHFMLLIVLVFPSAARFALPRLVITNRHGSVIRKFVKCFEIHVN